MTERAVVPAFPGATALTMLDVYDWIAPDGLRGGGRGGQALIAPTRPPTSLRCAKMKMARAGIMDSAVNA